MSDSSVPIPEISVADLAAYLQHPDLERQFVDVRESDELALANLPGFINLPLSQFSDWSPNIGQYLDSGKEILVLCHHGVRSAQMCYWLLNHGFDNVKNIRGGIHAYSLQVDSQIPLY
jgi:rhodanese-related sulfurtransferase